MVGALSSFRGNPSRGSEAVVEESPCRQWLSVGGPAEPGRTRKPGAAGADRGYGRRPRGRPESGCRGRGGVPTWGGTAPGDGHPDGRPVRAVRRAGSGRAGRPEPVASCRSRPTALRSSARSPPARMGAPKPHARFRAAHPVRPVRPAVGPTHFAHPVRPVRPVRGVRSPAPPPHPLGRPRVPQPAAPSAGRPLGRRWHRLPQRTAAVPGGPARVRGFPSRRTAPAHEPGGGRPAVTLAAGRGLRRRPACARGGRRRARRLGSGPGHRAQRPVRSRRLLGNLADPRP